MSQRQRAVDDTDEQHTERTAVDVSLPRKSVEKDVGLDVRLTDNVQANIGPARYFERDADGNAIESWDGVFQRVSQNVAEAEYRFGGDDQTVNRWQQAFESAMRELRFMPNSPTLMNAGQPLQQLSACVAGDAPVYTRNGLVAMEDVSVGDEVLTHTGEFKEVTAHWSNGVKDTVTIHRGTSKSSHRDVTVTPDHEVRTDDGEWVEAQSVSRAAQPTASPSVTFPETIDLTQYTDQMGKDKTVVSDDGLVRVENKDDPRTPEYDQQYSSVTAEIPNRSQFAWLGGVYLAEGDVDGTDLRFTIGSDETSFRDAIVSTLRSVFDTHVAVSESNAGEWVTISVSSPFVSGMFKSVFGSGVDQKSVPEWVFAGDESYQHSLLDGVLRGDGHESDSGWKLTMANPDLVYEVSLLARNCGYATNFKFRAENDLSARRTSSCYISTADRTALDNVVRSASEPVEVYDMEVADDHSFVVGDFVVHNCFVVEPGDSMSDWDEVEYDRVPINHAQTAASDIFKSGGGVGYPFHHLRPKGARVDSTGGVSSGPLSFMELFDTTCGTVKQGGKRRGAQMAIMHVQHPDIGRFAVSKRGEDTFTNFNISMGITDEFREAVENDDMYTLYDPSDGLTPADDRSPWAVVPETAHFYDPEFEDAWNDEFDKPSTGYDGKNVEANFWRDYADQMQTDFSEFRDRIDLEPGEPMELPARFIWQLLIDGAHNNGEPGIFYLDETNREHSFDVEEQPEHFIHSTNPCSEQPLEAYEACNLGHVNLSLMVDETAPTVDEFVQQHGLVQNAGNESKIATGYLNRALDHGQFEETIRTGVRFLDNVVTQSEFPIDEISEQVRGKRKIGLGLMGFHQMLIQMGIEYGSDLSYAVAEAIMERIDETATEYSHQLAQERGPFAEYSESKWADPTAYPDWFRKHAHTDPERHEDGYPVRNHNMTTIAPTGTTSMIGNTTGGCEPIYDVAFFKNVGDDIQGDEMLVEFDDYFLRVLDHNGIDVDAVKEEATDKMLNNEFDGIDSLDTVPQDIADLFVTTQDLSPEQHVRMQGAFQTYCDSGISKTLNMPNEATVEDVDDAFSLALDLGVKGTTVYRDGSRSEQVKTTRLDNDLDGDLDGVSHLLDQLDGETAKQVVDELEQDVQYERSCDECDSTRLDLSESCPVCMECGWSPCQ